MAAFWGIGINKWSSQEEPVSTPQVSMVSRCPCNPRDGRSGKAETIISIRCPPTSA